MAKHRVHLEVADMPAVLHAMRRKLANLLRRAAEDESPAVARRLQEIAWLFEAGLEEELGDERD